MTSLQMAVFSGFLVLTSGLSASAATVQNYTIRAEGGFTALTYGGLYSYDYATSAFQTHRDIAFTDAGSASLDDHPMTRSLRATSGSAQLRYDAEADPVWGNATLTGCTGFLTFLCTGATQIFDAATQSLRSFSVNSSMATLSAEGLTHQSDAVVGWTVGTTHFFNSGGVQTVDFAITSLEIELQPVPLPASLALLLAGLALLAGVRPAVLSKEAKAEIMRMRGEEKQPIAKIARTFKVSRSTIYRV